ncbi:hypothetical protein ACHQM5_025292 [Ranunculus cassubicifolius]
MTLTDITMAILCLLLLATVHVSMAQNDVLSILAAHNTPRAQVGVGPMTWSNSLATYAQDYAYNMASTCNLVHSGGPYGENLAWKSDSSMTYVEAVNMWVAERQYYRYSSNSCVAPAGQSCGHYTQVVWRDSVSVGCGGVICNSGATFIICSYSPPGNYIGQWPY